MNDAVRADEETALGDVALGRRRNEGWRSGLRLARWSGRSDPLGQPPDRVAELAGEIAASDHAVACGIETVLAAVSAQHHVRVIDKIAVDGNLGALDDNWPGFKPGRAGVVGCLTVCAFAKKHDVGDDAGSLVPEGVRRQPDRAQEVRPLRQVLADGRVLLVEREMAGDQGEDAAGLQRVNRLGEEEVMQRQPLAGVLELDVGERHVADHGVDASFGQAGIAEVFDADIGRRVERAGDPAGDGV